MPYFKDILFIHVNKNKKIKDYTPLLNKNSIDFINSYYDLDFKYFGYTKK